MIWNRSKSKTKKTNKEDIQEIVDPEDNQQLFEVGDESNYDSIIWGKWNDGNNLVFNEINIGYTQNMFPCNKKPTLAKFNFGADLSQNNDIQSPVETKIKDIVFGNQFKLALYSNGDLYSWGISTKGNLD